jgi:CheY-like chemotaxis protein
MKGYTVDCAQDGLSGLHLAATEHYDLIVLDIMLPGIDGYTLCKRLREDARRDTPVIMLTARDQLDDRCRASAPVPMITCSSRLPCPNWRRASKRCCAVPRAAVAAPCRWPT